MFVISLLEFGQSIQNKRVLRQPYFHLPKEFTYVKTIAVSKSKFTNLAKI